VDLSERPVCAYAMAMISRRSLLEGGPSAILAAFFAQSVAQGAAGPLFVQDLPKVSLDGWTVTATEVDYEPGGVNKPHRHPGFVLGYVLEGELRFQLKGGAERIVKTGEMFYEPPGAVHLFPPTRARPIRRGFWPWSSPKKVR